MGWTFTNRPHGQSVREFFEQAFNYDKPAEGKSGKIIACSATWTTAYMAYEIKSPLNRHLTDPTWSPKAMKREVVALVCLLRNVPRALDGYNFGYKDMDESMGPCEARCPKTILDLLTPTTHEYALEWRKRCQERIDKRKNAPKVHKGDLIKFAKPLTFGSGETHDALQWVRGSLFSGSGYGLYRISNWKELEYQNLGQHSFDKLGG
jgi:hypothetical protein